MNVLIVVNLNFLIILVNLDFVLLVAINMLEKEQRLFFKNVITVNIDTLSSLFLIFFRIFSEKIESFLIFYFRQFLKLFCLGSKININLKIIFLVLLLFYILMVEI